MNLRITYCSISFTTTGKETREQSEKKEVTPRSHQLLTLALVRRAPTLRAAFVQMEIE